MKTTCAIFLLLLYAVGAVVNAGFVFAREDAKYGYNRCLRSEYREALGFAVGFSLVPLWWPIVMFETGFYYYGWRLTPSRPYCN